MDSKLNSWDTVDPGMMEDERPSISPDLIDALHKTLEVGITCDEIVAILLLFVGFVETLKRVDGISAISKAARIVSILKQDSEVEKSKAKVQLINTRRT